MFFALDLMLFALYFQQRSVGSESQIKHVTHQCLPSRAAAMLLRATPRAQYVRGVAQCNAQCGTAAEKRVREMISRVKFRYMS